MKEVSVGERIVASYEMAILQTVGVVRRGTGKLELNYYLLIDKTLAPDIFNKIL